MFLYTTLDFTKINKSFEKFWRVKKKGEFRVSGEFSAARAEVPARNTTTSVAVLAKYVLSLFYR